MFVLILIIYCMLFCFKAQKTGNKPQHKLLPMILKRLMDMIMDGLVLKIKLKNLPVFVIIY